MKLILIWILVGMSMVVFKFRDSKGVRSGSYALTRMCALLGLGFSSVVAANTAPIILDIPNQLSKPGEAIEFYLYAYDPDNDPVSYVVSGLPDGLVFDEAYPTIEGTPSIEGDFQISIQMDDGSLTAEESFWWTISADDNAQAIPVEGPNVAPIITDIPNQFSKLGESINFSLYAYDPDKDPVSYVVSGLPDGLVFDETYPTIEGTPSIEGDFQISIQIDDGSLTAEESFLWTITAAETEMVDAVTNATESDVASAAANSTGIVSSDISNFASGNTFSWDALEKFPEDPSESNGPENPLDWKYASFANDATYIHLYYATHDASFLRATWGQTIYLDTDNNASTGWQSGLPIGADHVIQGRYIYRYEGDDNGTVWQWGLPTTMDRTNRQNENIGDEYRFPRSVIGNTESFNVVFVGSNEPYNGGELEDLYPDGVYDENSSNRFFTYRMASSGNSAPVVNAQTITIQENQNVAFTLDASDPDGDELTFTYQQAFHGLNATNSTDLSYAGPEVTYTPDSGFTGTDSFTYEVTDSNSEYQQGIVFISVVPIESQPLSNYTNNLVVDGKLEDWESLVSFANDPADNQSWEDNQVDLIRLAMAHSDTSLYVNYENSVESLAGVDDWAFNLYLDTDSNEETGYSAGMKIGSEYLIQGQSLYQYAGDGNSWSWTYLGDVERAVDTTGVEVRVDRAVIGNPESVRLVMIGDSISIGGARNDLYPNGIYSDNEVERKFFTYALEQSTYIAQNTLTLSDIQNKKAASGQLSVAAPQQLSINSDQSSNSENEVTANSGGGAVSIFGLFLCLFVSCFTRFTRRKQR